MKLKNLQYYIIAFCLLTIVGVRLEAQTISVTNFYLNDKDLTAQGRDAVEDQNGDRCALIRVQTTQKGFQFDVGSAGITKVEDNHPGEIWLWVPYGIKHISIHHRQLGSLPNYDFPISIEKARVYIMEISHEQIFVNNYDDTRKQWLRISVTPPNSVFTFNGIKMQLNDRGETRQELSFGTYTYKVECDGYYPREGQITINDSIQSQSLIINDLKPIMGKISVHPNPHNAKVFIDGVLTMNTGLEPKDIQIGQHVVRLEADGYKTDSRTVDVTENKTSDVNMALTQVANYSFTSSPANVNISVNGENIGTTPAYKELTTGTYTIKATKAGYKDYENRMSLSSSSPSVHVSLGKIFNYKNEFYFEANAKAGSMLAVGGTIGGFFNNINLEASYFYGFNKSETIYWSGNGKMPLSGTYTPTMNIIAKAGYGFATGTRYRITPQIGFSFVKMKEKMDGGVTTKTADGANVSSGLAALRFSAAITDHLGVSLTPEYAFALKKSEGFTALSNVSSKIKQWGDGFNVKLGLTVFF